MKRIVLGVSLICLPLASCRKSEAIDKTLAVKLVRIIVYNQRPSFPELGIETINANIDVYQDIVWRNAPGRPPDFDLRTALGAQFYKWEMYPQAEVLLGAARAKRDRTNDVREALSIYVNLLTGQPWRPRGEDSGNAVAERDLFLSDAALNEMADGRPARAIADLTLAIRARRDWRYLFDDLLFVNRMMADKPRKLPADDEIHQLNLAATGIFLSGMDGGWPEYIELLSERRETFVEAMLFENMMAIMSADAEIYRVDGHEAESAKEIAILREVAAALKRRRSNDLPWIEFLIDKANEGAASLER